jgi:hypothetical protein
MFRKSITLIATIAAVGALTLVATPSNAKPGNGNGGINQGGGNGNGGINPNPNKGGNKGPGMGNNGGNWNWKWGHNHHHKFWYGHAYYPSRTYTAVPVVAKETRGPCTCLTKGYTPEGQVIFKDVCTNEMAAGPAVSSPAADAAPQVAPQGALPTNQNVAQAQADPNNFAGRTFRDLQASQK